MVQAIYPSVLDGLIAKRTQIPSILATSLPVFFRRSPGVFPASFLIPSANLLANFSEIPLHHPNPGPILKLDLSPSSSCNSIAPL
ncbi:hypothetical protein BHM03_00055463 [Ensete ventricosum]|nr:hypothetical protein BHM03_00055463 [Ensete ventricosum]